MRIFTFGLALALFAILPAVAADISGKWAFSVDLDSGGHGDPSFELQQKGGKLTGTYTGPLGGYKVVGVVNGETAEFGFDFSQQGQLLKATYKAKIESAGKMSGTLTFTGSGSSSGGVKWTAVKQ